MHEVTSLFKMSLHEYLKYPFRKKAVVVGILNIQNTGDVTLGS